MINFILYNVGDIFHNSFNQEMHMKNFFICIIFF